MKNIKHPFDEAVVAQTHPALYMMHKYWARKPHNVVGRYIEYYTNPGDVVLDPFMGSGVTTIEAVRLGRKTIGNDLNPIASFITRMTLRPIDITKLELAFNRVEEAVKNTINDYYKTICSNSKCKREATITQVVWKRDKYSGEKLFLIKLECQYCKKKEYRKPTDEDFTNYEIIQKEAIRYFYPKNIPLHSTAKRSVEYIHELFVHRALLCLSLLLNEIHKEKDKNLQEMLLFCFTSNLGQMAKLNSIDMRKGREYSSRGWVIPNYWIPQGFLETNVWNGFAARFSKIIRGKKEAASFCKDEGEYQILSKDATNLNTLDASSIDYIFTDPPYGDAVPYFGLSLMWASWLGIENELKYDQEIIISERGDYDKELEDYRKRLKAAFREMYRVLKSNGTVTVTFHNREIKVWNALVAAATEAGFDYENDNYVLPAVKSSKSQLAVSGSMTGDIYINFRKPSKVVRQKELTLDEAHRIITKEAKMIIQTRNGQATTDQLARGIYSKLIKQNLFSQLPDTDIRKLLSTLPIVEKMPNVWALGENETESMLAYIPLYKRIEFIIDSVLESNHKHGFKLDDFLVPIFTHLKNGLTPDNKEILEVLKQRAYVKRDKWQPIQARQTELLPDYEPPKKFKLPEEDLREHEQFIYQLAQLGGQLGYQIWVGKNEQNKSEILQKLSVWRLEIPGLSEKFIADNRINQVDLIWLNPDEATYVAFEIENSTGVVPGIQRLANLSEKLGQTNLSTYVVIPDKFRGMAQRIFESPAGQKLGDEHRRVIVYSKLLHHIDLLQRKLIRPKELLGSISEPA
jgi:DNA modification methylase